MTMAEEEGNNNNVPLREHLVKTAVEFLQNPKVQSSPIGRKQEFLKKKGLTDDEIKTAFKLASVDITVDQNVVHSSNDYAVVSISPSPMHPYMEMHPYQATLFQRIKEFFNATALIGATIYCIYWFYKKFIEPFLFGQKKEDSIKDCVTELDKTIQTSMKEVKQSISKVEDDVQKLSQNQSIDPMIPQLVQELKQDLASLKSLLLSRKQFPTPDSIPAITIPAWQFDTAGTNQEKASEREDDTGSGSSTNTSDSSLEMIREEQPKV